MISSVYGVYLNLIKIKIGLCRKKRVNPFMFWHNTAHRWKPDTYVLWNWRLPSSFLINFFLRLAQNIRE